MKIYLAQLNYHVGNFKKNSQKIIEQIEQAQTEGADLVVFSELAVCGYPPLDLLTRREFVEAAARSLQEIAGKCRGIAAVMGAPVLNPQSKGKQLFNAACFLHDGKVLTTIHKTLLPTYDVFDEYRYFQPNEQFEVINYKGRRLALTICEDLWDDRPQETSFHRDHLYTLSPMQKLAALKPDLVINIAASPFSYHQEQTRREIICKKAADYQVPIVYVNQTGANTDLIFDGSSMVINRRGEITRKLKAFSEDRALVEWEDIEQTGPPKHSLPEPIEQIHDALVMGVRDYFAKSGLKKAVTGLSGGIDSAVTAAIAVNALGKERVEGLLLPSQYSTSHSVDDAVALAENLGIKTHQIAIEPVYNSVERVMQPVFKNLPPDVTEENIQARIRGLLLMAYSNKFGAILLNTSNKSEAAVGYGTLYGDMNGGLSVLGDVYKTDVFKLAAFINRHEKVIPHNTITKPPSAELRPDQQDTDSLPPYDILDPLLFKYIELGMSREAIVQEGFNQQTVEKIVRLVNLNEYKRFQAPPVLRISGKAFGPGRRMPLVARYQF